MRRRIPFKPVKGVRQETESQGHRIIHLTLWGPLRGRETRNAIIWKETMKQR